MSMTLVHSVVTGRREPATIITGYRSPNTGEMVFDGIADVDLADMFGVDEEFDVDIIELARHIRETEGVKRNRAMKVMTPEERIAAHHERVKAELEAMGDSIYNDDVDI